jgi:hypothetical protein
MVWYGTVCATLIVDVCVAPNRVEESASSDSYSYSDCSAIRHDSHNAAGSGYLDQLLLLMLC